VGPTYRFRPSSQKPRTISATITRFAMGAYRRTISLRMTMVVSETEIVPCGMLSFGFDIRAVLFAEDLGWARGVLKAFRANERSSDSPISPAATSAAPRAT